MATAAVISWDDTREACAKTCACQELHAYLEHGLESVEATMPDDTPSLAALTHAVLALRQEWTGKITEGLVAQRRRPSRIDKTSAYSVRPACTSCLYRLCYGRVVDRPRPSDAPGANIRMSDGFNPPQMIGVVGGVECSMLATMHC
jgi:hypothetical protein